MTSDIDKNCLINGVEYKCRTCFDPGRNIYSLKEETNNSKTWRDVLKDVANFETNNDELLPKTLCSKCLEKLKKLYEFVLQIQDVNKKYSELLAKSGVSNEVNNFTDCLAESAIALPLEKYIPDIKLEEEMALSYNLDMSNNKLGGYDDAKSEHEDIDDPFTETFESERSLDQLEENESAKAKSGENATKRNRAKKVKHSCESENLFSKPVKRSKKPKQPKKTVNMTTTEESDETKNVNENVDVKETIVCDKCSQTFPTIHTYQRHQQSEHSSEANEKNKCPICSKEFKNSWYVVDHIKVVHDKLKPYKCSYCQKDFASAHSKRIHELTHTDSFPYACEYCDRRFRLCSKLKIHSEIHTTKPELLCPICKRSQKSQEELEVHVKNHDDNRLQCPACGHLFRRNAQLKDHYNAVHLKLRPYKCEFCELGFGDRKTRRVHQRTHHKPELSIT